MAAFAILIMGGCRPHQTEAQAFKAIDRQIEAGEFDAAEDAAKRAWQLNPDSEWGWKFKSQYILLLLYKNDKAAAAKLLKDHVPAAFSTLRARYQYLRTYLARRQKDPSEAELGKSALAMARQQGDSALQCDVLVLMSNLDDKHEFELLTEALTIAQQHHLDFQAASALMNLGMLMQSRGRYSDGIAYLLLGAASARRAQARVLEAGILINLGVSYLNLGDLDRALQSFRDARPQLRQTDHRSLRADVNMEMGKIYSLRQQNDEAVAFFRAAFQIIKEDSTLELYIPACQKLASGLIETHQLQEAEEFNELSNKALQDNHISDPYLVAFYNLNRADIAGQRNRVGEAEALYREVLRTPAHALGNLRWSAYARRAALLAQQGHVPEARQDFERAVNAIEENRLQQKATEYQITFLSALIRFYQQYVEFLVKQGNTQEALAVADSSRASVLTQGLQSSRKEADFMNRVAKEARRSNSALLFYWLAPQKSYVWVITPKGEDLKELPGSAAITRDVQDYSRAIQSADEDLLSTPNPAGVRLYETLIKPVSSRIEKGMRVAVVPDGALHGLNFETLVVNDAKPHYWIDDVSITVAPSLRILLDKNNAPQNSVKALVIGDGDYSGASDKYPPLPESKKEVAGVSALFPNVSSVLTQAQAVPEAYRKAQPASFSLIHFSAHVEANENSPLDSAIILSPGEYGRRELYARDLMRNPLRADLVTISGCNSVGKKVLSGEGMVGFAWAAFEAGARNAVTSLWEVDDRSTTELMNRFYTEVTQGKPYAIALRDAKLAMLKGSFKKPYYWAPFQLYSRSLGDRSLRYSDRQ